MTQIQNEYFSSYEDLEIHRIMLEDVPRTAGYKNAIFTNRSYFKDKVIMDVGCGTGILSIFCAQAGAKKVYAIEASKIATLAKEIVKENEYENVIEVIQGRVEDLVLPNNIKVDAIVSEWMGFYLLHEGMLDSVLIARDKFLKEGGAMFPESATIYVAPCSLPSLYKKWDNKYSVSMSSFAKQLRSNKSNKPEIIDVKKEDLLAPEEALCWINLKEDKVSDLNSYSMEHVVGCNKNAQYQGLCLWFDCTFPDLTDGHGDGPVVLSTSPASDQTHWKQTVIVLPESLDMEEGEPIAFKLDMNRDGNICRRYNLQMSMLDPETIEHPLPCSCHMTKCILVKAFMEKHPEIPSESMENRSNCMEDDVIGEYD